MPLQLTALEARIVRILVDWYPITADELRDELSLRKDVLERTLKSLVVKGVVALEPLSDKTYVRLLVPEIDVSALVAKDRGRRRPRRPGSGDGTASIMYA